MMDNPELALARRFIETTGTHLFLTGKAGTGKTTFLKSLKAESPKRMVVLAPTGIAALQAGGVTIHSFFQLPLAPFVPGSSFTSGNPHDRHRFSFSTEKKNIIRSIDLLVIDEISMVRADLLDAVDDALRRLRRKNTPFGGVQLLMIGDLQQLSPVVKDDEWPLLRPHYSTPYFFSSQALRRTRYCTIELQTVYRQTDARFLELLNRARVNHADAELIDELNARYRPNFRPPEQEGYIRLVTHQAQAQRINTSELDALPGPSFTYKADIEGKFPSFSYPTDELLTLKRGARVMFVKNDSSGAGRYINGLTGRVTELGDNFIEVTPQGSQTPITLNHEEWTNCRYALDKETKEIREEMEGAFRQYPLKTAWAITIHKSQGLTFDRVIIDASQSFAHGQTYVALSRCRTLEGIVLSQPLSPSAFIGDDAVEQFTNNARQTRPTPEGMSQMQQAYYAEMLTDLFDFKPVDVALRHWSRLMEEHLYKVFPRLTEDIRQAVDTLRTSVLSVADKFAVQRLRLIGEAGESYASDATLQERLRRGATYFDEQLKPLTKLASRSITEVDNREVRNQLQDAVGDLRNQLTLRRKLLAYVAENGFSLTEYMHQRAMASMRDDDAAEKQKQAKEKRMAGRKEQKQANKQKATDKIDKEEKDTVAGSSDIANPALFRQLRDWRREEADKRGVPVYMVVQQNALIGIANLLPTSRTALLRVPFVGKLTAKRYGKELTTMVQEFLKKRGVDKAE